MSNELKLNSVSAVGLLSGGLDSSLACAIMKKQGINIIAINFSTGFCVYEHKRAMKIKNGKIFKNEALRAGAEIGFEVEIIDISEEYFNIVLNPKYGYGSCMNPCIDCRIFMLKKSKEIMEERRAKFVFTGEVLGQRPMSQRKDTLNLIERESGLNGYLLRPLSAKCLPETIPEKEGWVRRESLYGINGRGRKEQIRLAEEFGIKNYPQPAGGCCFLVDENFSRRLSETLERGQKKITKDELVLLKVGRHFRLGSVKLIVGRNMEENEFLMRFRVNGRRVFKVLSHKGPLAIAIGEIGVNEEEKIAEILARYSDAEKTSEVEIEMNDGERLLRAKAISEDELEQLRV